MGMKMTIRILNEKGELEREEEAHSWVFQMLQLLCCQMANGLTQTVLDTGNSARATAANASILRCNAGTGVVTHGIVVGTGVTANAPTQYNLNALINHGSSAGQLNYGAVSFVEPVVGGSTITLVITRTVTNATASTITINEIAIYAYAASAPYYACICRDKLSVGVDVAAGATKTIQYTISETN